jgi:hypothetical protein
MMFPQQMTMPRMETDSPFERRPAHHKGHRHKPKLSIPPLRLESQQSKLIGKEAAIVVQPHVPPRREPMLKVERILTMDYAATQARSKGVTSAPCSRRGMAEGTVAKATTF